MHYLLFLFLALTVLLLPEASAAQTIVPTLKVSEMPVQNTNHYPAADERFFQIQSVDTMKYSRDRARNPYNEIDIPTLVQRVAAMHVTHISISTPYDEEFYPIMKAWVDESRKYNLKIWFRGNWSSFEGWFGYPKMTDPDEHHLKTAEFIRKHPELFQEGDIFTPSPEPENGAIGDPRVSKDGGAAFNAWLVQSQQTCVEGMAAIGKLGVKCGYFSTNGDVAWYITSDTYAKIGNRIVIDHYVKTAVKLRKDIERLHAKYGIKILLGEFGAPILDINGPMTEYQQAVFIKEIFHELLKVQDKMEGVNYWVIFDGPTTLYNGVSGGFTMRHAGRIVKRYYRPIVVTGTVIDQNGKPVAGAEVATSAYLKTKTDANGMYKLRTTRDFLTLTVKKEGFQSYSKALSTYISFNGYEATTFKVALNPQLRTIATQQTLTEILRVPALFTN